MNTNIMNRLKVVLQKNISKANGFSEHLGVSRATVSQWVNNTSQLSLEMISK